MNYIPNGFYLASYRGKRGTLLEQTTAALGKRLDHGEYSHTELLFDQSYNRISASSSAPDKGVRFKHIEYSKPNNWDFVALPSHMQENAYLWYVAHEGAKYDYTGNLRFATNFINHDLEKYFCTESNLQALGFPEPWRYGPSHATVLLSWLYNSPILRYDNNAGVLVEKHTMLG